MLFRRTKHFILQEVIDGCRKGKSSAQKMLFEAYYSFGVNICLRYASSREDAEEMFDDGFLKVLNKITYYDPEQSFDAWFRTIMVRTAIDQFRKYKNEPSFIDVDDAWDLGTDDEIPGNIAADEILQLVQRLPSSYRTVFSLHVVDGYSHPEIAGMLGIQEGTSRSTLVKARLKLQELLRTWNHEHSISRRNNYV
ncbi:RNA polymerase subunit sigma-24 [Arsenicibacter rosenii]|uniref:RNA polymerase subunit sigma-24 n=2 Tax=Arsenicibacter rosenii TaxID=1750698 RepID=A0A1S2VA76_9BACT|nr:RNA polymerase subunit sigma-24 [Arsenicibacter rosenii]